MILLKWLWISLKTFTTPLYLINLSTGNCKGLTSTGAHYSAIVVFQFLGIGTVNRFDGVRATPASLHIEFLLANPVQFVKYVCLHATEIWTIVVNGALACALLKVHTPPIWTYHTSVKLNVSRVGEDFLRGSERGTLIKLAASSATLHALPERLLPLAHSEASARRRRDLLCLCRLFWAACHADYAETRQSRSVRHLRIRGEQRY